MIAEIIIVGLSILNISLFVRSAEINHYPFYIVTMAVTKPTPRNTTDKASTPSSKSMDDIESRVSAESPKMVSYS